MPRFLVNYTDDENRDYDVVYDDIWGALYKATPDNIINSIYEVDLKGNVTRWEIVFKDGKLQMQVATEPPRQETHLEYIQRYPKLFDLMVYIAEQYKKHASVSMALKDAVAMYKDGS